jgi:MFS transporter, OFA family, oxalate/formate antiporter
VSEFRNGWRPLGAAFLGVSFGASPVPFNVFPLVVGPINAAYGWNFTSISLGVTIFGLIASLMAPVFGGLADRHGVRRVALVSLTAFAVVWASFYFVPPTLAAWWGFWAVLGAIGIGSTPVTWSRAISIWFNKNRGLALGLMLVGTSFSAAIIPRIANAAMAMGDWRLAFPATALPALLIALPLGLMFFREPRPEERPGGLSDASGTLFGQSLSEAARGRRFWILIASILCIALAYGGAHLHIVQMVKFHGLTGPGDAANILLVVSVGILSGRLIVGALFDRLWAPGVAFPALLMPALACWLLMGTATPVGLVMFAAFLLGFAAGTESDVIAYLAARYFGMRHYGRIYGFLYMPFGIGSAVSPILYGVSRDSTGNYDAMLMIAAVMFVVGGALLLLLGRYPDAKTEAA